MKRFSDILTLNIQDFIKGLIVAVGGAVFAVIESSITAEQFTIDWSNIWHVALGSGLAYIGKQFFTGHPKSVEVDSTKTDIVIKPIEK